MVSRWALALDHPPTVSAGGPYSLDEGGTVTLTATGSDPDGDVPSYAWDLDGNGTFETPGQSVSFAADDGPATVTVTVRATDSSGVTATDTATITVRNVPPTATLVAPASARAGFPFTLSADESAGPVLRRYGRGLHLCVRLRRRRRLQRVEHELDGELSDGRCRTRSVAGRIRDKDGGIGEQHATVVLTVTTDSLCALVRSYVTEANKAKELCDKLAEIAKADGKGKDTDKKIADFQKKVRDDVPKWLTAAQADVLIRLSDAL